MLLLTAPVLFGHREPQQAPELPESTTGEEAQSSQPVFRSDINFVRVDAIVTDFNGRSFESHGQVATATDTEFPGADSHGVGGPGCDIEKLNVAIKGLAADKAAIAIGTTGQFD